MYVNEVLSGQCDGKAKPTIIKETPGTAYVDGHNGIGSVSTVCMVKLATIKIHSAIENFVLPVRPKAL